MFSFKKFTIKQENSAMKVCTDSCIFGASIDTKNATNVLDIGSGTGLLSLMIAQKSRAQIHAVEIDKEAAEESIFNVSNSNYSEQIQIFNQSIQNFASKNTNKYDLIVSNPPFFQNSLLSNNAKQNNALHNNSLQFVELIEIANKLISTNGVFWVLLPKPEMDIFEKLCFEKNLFPAKKLIVRHDDEKKILRVIICFQKNQDLIIEEDEICIYNKKDNTYTLKFKELLKDYYIIF